MKPGRLALAFLLLGAASLSAQAPDTATLESVVISATKTPAAKSSLPQAVTRISGEELRNRGITHVAEALKLVPGVSIVQNGSTGSVSSLFLRGGESRYTRVLIDGVTVNSPGGYFDFSHLTTDNIERIEIVRGPASVVYGADAISGIVQIFTRQGRGRLNGSAEAKTGNYGSREVTLSGNGEGGPLRYSLGGGMRRSDGILPFNNNYYNGTLSGSAGATLSEGADALLSARYTAAEFHYPTDYTGAPVDSNSYRVQHRLTVGLNASSRFTERFTGRLVLGTNEVSDLSEDILLGSSQVRLESALLSRNKRRSAEAGLSVRLPAAATLNVGAEFQRESEASRNYEGPVGAVSLITNSFNADRNNTAAYSELVAVGPRGGTLILAARRDDNSDYDAFSTYRAGATMPLRRSLRVRGSISTSFSAPAFNQLRPTLYTIGSPDLKPERARSWEVGFDQTFGDGFATVAGTYFNQRFSDLIQYVSGGPPNYLGSFANLTEARSNGYEFEVSATPLPDWRGSASYTLAAPRATSVPAGYEGNLREGDALIRRATHIGTLSVAWSRAAIGFLSATTHYTGKRPDVDFNEFPSPTVTLPGYAKVDLAGNRVLVRGSARRPGVSLTARIDNVLDKQYEDVLHFSAPGRMFLIGARLEGAM